MHKSNILLPGIYLTSEICLSYSKSPAVPSLRKQLGWIRNPGKMPWKERQNISAEKCLIPTRAISCMHFGFLLGSPWTYGEAGATVILLVSWCLNFCSAVFDLAWGNHQSGLPLAQSMLEKVEKALYQRPTWWVHQRDLGLNAEVLHYSPVPHPHPVALTECLDLLGECILRPGYARWPMNWYLEVYFTCKRKAGHRWLCLWFPS